MADPLFAIRDRLTRVDEQFEKVKAMIRQYLNSTAYRYTGEYDPNAGRLLVRQDIQFPPIRLATRVGEVVHDLRSSLDHLAWELVKANGGKPTEDTYFPILRIAPAANKHGVSPPPNVPGGVSQTAAALIEGVQPYLHGFKGDEPLWLLHRMSITDKHRHIAIKGIRFDDFSFGGEHLSHFTWTMELVSATEYAAELRLVPDDPAVNVQGSASVFVIIHEPATGEAALISTIESIINHVRSIVNEASATCFGP